MYDSYHDDSWHYGCDGTHEGVDSRRAIPGAHREPAQVERTTAYRPSSFTHMIAALRRARLNLIFAPAVHARQQARRHVLRRQPVSPQRDRKRRDHLVPAAKRIGNRGECVPLRVDPRARCEDNPLISADGNPVKFGTVTFSGLGFISDCDGQLECDCGERDENDYVWLAFGSPPVGCNPEAFPDVRR